MWQITVRELHYTTQCSCELMGLAAYQNMVFIPFQHLLLRLICTGQLLVTECAEQPSNANSPFLATILATILAALHSDVRAIEGVLALLAQHGPAEAHNNPTSWYHELVHSGQQRHEPTPAPWA